MLYVKHMSSTGELVLTYVVVVDFWLDSWKYQVQVSLQIIVAVP